MNKKVIGKQLCIGRWFYPEPELNPDEAGNIVIVSKMSVGPCESFEWGISSDMSCFEKYTWSEDEWFEDTSYTKITNKIEMLKVIEEMKNLIQGTSLEYWNFTYDDFIKKYLN